VNRRGGVLICGSYGHGNAGDEAILEAIVSAFRRARPETPLSVLSRSPAETAKKHGVAAYYKFNPFAVLRELRRARLYLNGGGSLIQDVTSSRSLWYYLFTLAAAKALGCRVIMYGCGIGPVRRPLNRRLARWVIDRSVDVITLREPDSLEEIRAFGVTKSEMLVTSDPALTLDRAPAEAVDKAMAALGLERGGRYLCIAPRRWTGFEARARCFAECADALYEKHGLETVFLSIDHRNDALAADVIARQMRAPCHIARELLPARETIGVLARMDLVISMRLHGLIFAAGQGVPLVGVSYDPKVNAFLRAMEQDNCLDLEALTPETLLSAAENALAGRDGGAQRAAALRAREQVNLEQALRLLDL